MIATGAVPCMSTKGLYRLTIANHRVRQSSNSASSQVSRIEALTIFLDRCAHLSIDRERLLTFVSI